MLSRITALGATICLWLSAPLLLAGPMPACAQTPAKALEIKYDATFQEMLKKPSDLDVLFRFATVAIQTGDLEGAISALERMLLFDPNLPRVRLELGILYYRLESWQVARAYLESALQSRSLPPDSERQARQFIAAIGDKQDSSQFAGEIFVGTRYQSNANLGPATSSVVLFGQTANLNEAGLGRADWGGVASAQVRHRYDLGQQDKSALESQVTLYTNRQFQLQAANVSLVDFTTGPRFEPFEGLFEGVTIKPMGLLGFFWVNDLPYYGSYGAAVEAGAMLSDRLRNTSYAAYRRLLYQNSWYLPLNSTYTGNEYSVNTTFRFALTEIVTLFANGSVQRYIADTAPFYSYMLMGTSGGMQFQFPDPLFRSGLPWLISFSANVQWWTYDQPDPVIAPSVTRRQNDTILNLILAIPFDERTTMTVSGGRFVRSANLPNYAFGNNSIMTGVTWRF